MIGSHCWFLRRGKDNESGILGFFFSSGNKHEIKGNKNRGRNCPGPVAAIQGEVGFFLVISSEKGGEK